MYGIGATLDVDNAAAGANYRVLRGVKAATSRIIIWAS